MSSIRYLCNNFSFRLSIHTPPVLFSASLLTCMDGDSQNLKNPWCSELPVFFSRVHQLLINCCTELCIFKLSWICRPGLEDQHLSSSPISFKESIHEKKAIQRERPRCSSRHIRNSWIPYSVILIQISQISHVSQQIQFYQLLFASALGIQSKFLSKCFVSKMIKRKISLGSHWSHHSSFNETLDSNACLGFGICSSLYSICCFPRWVQRIKIGSQMRESKFVAIIE